MSKHNPNQDFYKTKGRGQSEGPDRLDANVNADKHQLAQNEKAVKHQDHPEHPAVQRAKRK